MCSGVMKSIYGHKYFSNDKLLTDAHNLFHDLQLRENLPYTFRAISESHSPATTLLAYF